MHVPSLLAATPLALFLLIAGTPAFSADPAEGPRIFQQACATCHTLAADPSRHDEMVAPPFEMVAWRTGQLSDGDANRFTARVVDYIRAPAENKSAMPMAVQRFGLMPAIGDTYPDLTEAQLRTVAHWMFDLRPVTSPAMMMQHPGGSGTGN